MERIVSPVPGIVLCFLYLFFTAMSCEEYDDLEDYVPPLVDVCGVHQVSLDNSGKEAFEIVGNRCPKEAYMLSIVPEVELIGEGGKEDYYYYYDLLCPITAIRIITLTDFNEDYPAGSDVYPLFYRFRHSEPYHFPVTNWEKSELFLLVLLTYPQPGFYKFRVEIEVGEQEQEQDSEQARDSSSEIRVYTAETEFLEFY